MVRVLAAPSPVIRVTPAFWPERPMFTKTIARRIVTTAVWRLPRMRLAR